MFRVSDLLIDQSIDRIVNCRKILVYKSSERKLMCQTFLHSPTFLILSSSNFNAANQMTKNENVTVFFTKDIHDIQLGRKWKQSRYLNVKQVYFEAISTNSDDLVLQHMVRYFQTVL